MIETTSTLVVMLGMLAGLAVFVLGIVWFVNWLRKFMHYSNEKVFKPFDQAINEEWKKRKEK